MCVGGWGEVLEFLVTTQEAFSCVLYVFIRVKDNMTICS